MLEEDVDVKRCVVATAVVLLALGACAQGGLPEGQLLSSIKGNRYEITYAPPVGHGFTVGLQLHPLDGAVLESVTLVNPSDGLVLLPPLAARLTGGKPMTGLDADYPPKPHPWKLYPVNGFQVRTESQVLVGLKVNSLGVFHTDGVRIRYRVGSAEYDALYPMRIVVGL